MNKHYLSLESTGKEMIQVGVSVPGPFHGLNGRYHKMWVPLNIGTLLSKTLYTYLAT